MMTAFRSVSFAVRLFARRHALRPLLAVVGTFWLVSGCSTLPSYDSGPGARPIEAPVPPTIAEVVNHIQCEILALLDDKSGKLEALKSNLYVVNANLTLDITDSQGFAPSLSFIHPLNPATTNRTLSISGQITGTQHRNINLTFNLALVEPKLEDKKRARFGACRKGDGLNGNLGIREVVLSGLQYSSSREFIFPLTGPKPSGAGDPAPRPMTCKTTDPLDCTITGTFSCSPTGKIECEPSKAPIPPPTPSINANIIPTFGSTIDFTMVYGLGGAPNWTLTQFKGPSGGSNLLNFTRTNKETLVISFAAAKVLPPDPSRAESLSFTEEGAPTAAPPETEQAVRAAQENSTRMILQRLLQ